MKTVRGCHALITGAASGIGRATAVELARRGCHVWLVDVRGEELAESGQLAARCGVEVMTRTCDLADVDALERTAHAILHHWPRLNILINCAGVLHYGPTAGMTRAQCSRVLDVNVGGAIHLTRVLLPSLVLQPEAHIVNVSSMYGLLGGRRLAVYSASKFALVGFTEALRFEYGRSGVGASAVCPGFVRTGLFDAMTNGFEDRHGAAPPRWLTTTPERIAGRIVDAIRRNRRQVVVTPLAHAMLGLKRFLPGAVDRLYLFGRRKRVGQRHRDAAIGGQDAPRRRAG